ncbi:hypothetical protein BGZ96_000940 [Linnemannia gamsii]|uniref:DEAD/DEAH-box helicase domain-containing protein n=1 Tax=Linnemannia gamsii TaxID=64522 RepID=A0ABQ7JN85_9FUNG|nr:hypothetical protein BGZ96_000940 [Linnemannia gamsii]
MMRQVNLAKTPRLRRNEQSDKAATHSNITRNAKRPFLQAPIAKDRQLQLHCTRHTQTSFTIGSRGKTRIRRGFGSARSKEDFRRDAIERSVLIFKYAPKEEQLQVVEHVAEQKDCVLLAPCGRGKTLAYFLPMVISSIVSLSSFCH